MSKMSESIPSAILSSKCNSIFYFSFLLSLGYRLTFWNIFWKHCLWQFLFLTFFAHFFQNIFFFGQSSIKNLISLYISTPSQNSHFSVNSATKSAETDKIALHFDSNVSIQKDWEVIITRIWWFQGLFCNFFSQKSSSIHTKHGWTSFCLSFWSSISLISHGYKILLTV